VPDRNTRLPTLLAIRSRVLSDTDTGTLLEHFHRPIGPALNGVMLPGSRFLLAPIGEEFLEAAMR